MFIGKVKNIFIKTIPGQAGIVQINPGTSGGGSQDVQHTVLSEIRMEENGELILEDGVDLLVAENTSSCYLMVSGEIRYEV
ncbi:hypothetical protein EB169_10325 [archaeon]|nr:hypothetical protein [archaeon]NDB56210.1 hypothetical protein [archaeon]